jgi:hypothetical protein
MKDVLTASLYDESAWSLIQSHERGLGSPRRPLPFARHLLRELALKLLRRRSVLLVEERPFDATKRCEGRDWPLFGYTMAGRRRLDNVQACIEDVLKKNVPGDFIETGAWRGGTTIFMRAMLKARGVTNRKVWVADSFNGLPGPKCEDDGGDLSHLKYLHVPLERVKSNFAKFGLLDRQVEFLAGWFCDTLPRAPIQKLAVLRLDGDIYSSTMDSLQHLYHRVSKGGYVIIDDFHSWPSCRKAVTDFLSQNGVKPQIKTIDWSGAYFKV